MLYPLLTMSEAEWNYGYTEQSQLMFMDVPMEQFQLVTYLQMLPTAIYMLFAYIGMGFVGGAIALKMRGIKIKS